MRSTLVGGSGACCGVCWNERFCTAMVSPRFSSKPIAAAARVSICFNSSGVRLRRFSVAFPICLSDLDCVVDQQCRRDATNSACWLQGMADGFVDCVGSVFSLRGLDRDLQLSSSVVFGWSSRDGTLLDVPGTPPGGFSTGGFLLRGLHGDRHGALGIVCFLIFFAGAGIIFDVDAGANSLRSNYRLQRANQSCGQLFL